MKDGSGDDFSGSKVSKVIVALSMLGNVKDQNKKYNSISQIF